MSIYLSRIEERNGFYNLRPVMEKIDSELIEVDATKFGQYGTITIQMVNGYDVALVKDEKYCIFNISDSELKGLEQNSSGWKIRLSSFLSKAKIVDSSTIREVITVPNQINEADIIKPDSRILSNILPPLSKKVFLKFANSVLGPFTWDVIDDVTYKFSPSANNDDIYLIDKYATNDISDLIYTFDAASRVSDIYYGQEREVLLIDTLPDAKSKIDLIDNNSLKVFVSKLISQSVESKKEKQELKNAITSLPDIQLSEKRRDKILELVNNGEFADQTLNLIPSIILNDESSLSKVAEAVLGNDNYNDKLYTIIKTRTGFQEIIDRIDKEKRQKEVELEDLNSKIQTSEKIIKENPSTNNEEISKLEHEKSKLTEELADLKNRLNLALECEDIERQTKDLENQYNALLTMKNNISHEITQKVQSAYADFAFDGAIASVMLQEASRFENSQKKKNDNNIRTATFETIKNYWRVTEPKELIAFIYDELTTKAKRNIKQNDVVNLILCTSLGFLTIFAGEPGTGKTSLVSLFSQILGLAFNNRYVEIAVEKGWTSRRDLIGYYNPLTKTFDTSNIGLFTTFETLNAESRHKIEDFPFFVLLDEANLSQMEHYWADFMNVCDLDKNVRQISLSEEYVFNIPNTLRFLATINLDHTTEILSPRLIDRAWVILLQSSEVDIEELESPQIDIDYPAVSNDVFTKIQQISIQEGNTVDPSLVEKFNKIKACFKNIGLNISPRITGMIKRYCIAGKDLFDKSENAYVALDYAIAQKILPMINGYGDVYQKFIDELLLIADNNTMPKCFEILNSIKKKASSNMQYYQFFSR